MECDAEEMAHHSVLQRRCHTIGQDCTPLADCQVVRTICKNETQMMWSPRLRCIPVMSRRIHSCNVLSTRGPPAPGKTSSSLYQNSKKTRKQIKLSVFNKNSTLKRGGTGNKTDCKKVWQSERLRGSLSVCVAAQVFSEKRQEHSCKLVLDARRPASHLAFTSHTSP